MDGLDARKQELELEKSVRRLREKFHGKIPVKTAVLLMKQFANNHDLACRRIILCMDTLNDVDPDEQQDLEMDKVAMNVINKIKEDDEVSKDLMNNKDIKVSRCHRCRRKYDPVPVDKMWGLAEFQCLSCNRTFKGLGQMGIPSPCYTCNIPVLPSCILPPQRPQGPRTRNPHSCYAEDCYNRREPHVPGLHCVHPKSRSRNRLPKVLQPSLLHVSSGSTVATCLSQGSLIECDLDDLIMDDIAETDEEESDGSD
ncbi:shiftless antiviral inhibitor of ribosomal frameshifting protein isoform X2 [Bombina bombina]|uniref:shiftless antiviral inhibitor of ribosomal frameshifting protein isoform X2 n=1 Tax=Bombina bombina TaxID=8345 RepID=UPI00235ACEEC|nr:shiftless antiviral inhibitor of ribosomal frameshifting protein isoform X2 [Bombina bombina]